VGLVTCDHEAQIRDLLEEREELLTEIRRLRMGRHPAGRALRESDLPGPHSDPYCATHCSTGSRHSQCGCRCNHRAGDTAPVVAPELWDRATVHADNVVALAEALTERDAEHEGGGGA
jgi:hypothetical protein